MAPAQVPKRRPGLHEGLQHVEEAGAFQVLEERRGFAAGKDHETVEPCQLLGLAYKDGLRADGLQHARMRVERALQRENADDGLGRVGGIGHVGHASS